MTTSPPPDRVTALYDAIDAFQREHRTGGGLQHAQIRALLAEHLDRALGAVPAVVPPADQTALRRQFGEVLRRWGLLDEVNDPKAAEEFAVTDLLAVPPVSGRADTLRWAADRLEAWQPEPSERWAEAERNRYEDGVDAAADWLRRLAGEAAQPEPTIDRPAVYREVADRLAADAEQGDKEGLTRIYRRSAVRQVRAWADDLDGEARQDTTPDSEAPCWEQTSSGTWRLAVDGGYVEVPEHITAHERAMFLAEWHALRSESGQPGTNTEAPVCPGFVWIGQSFKTCDRCGQPAWEHDGEEVAAEDAGPFDNRRTVRPWKPGQADAIRAKWERS